jgi:hypothetical protein
MLWTCTTVHLAQLQDQEQHHHQQPPHLPLLQRHRHQEQQQHNRSYTRSSSNHFSSSHYGCCLMRVAACYGVKLDAVDLYNSASGTWSTFQLLLARHSLVATSFWEHGHLRGGQCWRRYSHCCHTLRRAAVGVIDIPINDSKRTWWRGAR